MKARLSWLILGIWTGVSILNLQAADMGRKIISENPSTVGALRGADQPKQDEPPANPKVGLQLALYNPAQLFPENYDVYGMRLSLVYGRNQNVSGFDLGLVNQVTGEFTGCQLGIYNGVKDASDGAFQFGLLNEVDRFTGLQLGALNLAKDVEGVQIGLVNMTERMDGVQIGLFNFILKGDFLIFCPIVNGSF